MSLEESERWPGMRSEKVGESASNLPSPATHLCESRVCGLLCFFFRGVDLGVTITGFFFDLADFLGLLLTF